MKFFETLFNPKKWTLGTIGDIAGLAGGAITGGLLPGSQALGLGLSAAGGLFGSNSGSGSGQATYRPGQTEQMLDQIGQGDLRFVMGNRDKYYRAVDNAASALDPRGDAANADYYRNSLLRGADLSGRRNANDLRRRGYASGVGDAAMLDARNQAATQGNEYFASLRNPASMAQRYAGQADLYNNPGMFGESLSSRLMLQNQQNNQRMEDLRYEQSRPATGLESLIGLAGQFGPYLNNRKDSSGPKPKTAPKQKVGSSLIG